VPSSELNNSAENRWVIPAVVAHRGNAREFPENTLASLRSAIEIGALFVEFDVQLAADEIPVVIHDDTLVRTGGRPESVFDLTAAELAQIEVAERTRFEDRFSDTCVPSLVRAVELLAGYPHAKGFVEIKRESLRRFGHDMVLRRVLDALRPARAQCIVISFDLRAVHQAREISGLPIGWVLERYDSHSRLKFEALKPDYIFCNHRKFPADGSRLSRGPWRWASYEVESAEQAMALAERGVELAETMSVGPVLRGLRKLQGAAP
jgi:glycerophosphoryl diester phosphodiesterase